MSGPPPTEADRVREVYAERARRGLDERYGLENPANRYLFARREEALLRLLSEHGLRDLAKTRIIDVGCGNGGVLADFVRYGADPALMAGIDLLPDRIEAAGSRLPGADLRVGDATSLPFDDASFDIALQFTLLSSVLDGAVRAQIARETLRVLRPGGALVWYDFTWNPTNRDVRGIGLRELRALYAGCQVDAQRVTLAPPLTRLLARRSTRLCRMLEVAPFLRTHLLAIARRL
jgi:SAM-dependent methyltransferase